MVARGLAPPQSGLGETLQVAEERRCRVQDEWVCHSSGPVPGASVCLSVMRGGETLSLVVQCDNLESPEKREVQLKNCLHQGGLGQACGAFSGLVIDGGGPSHCGWYHPRWWV